MITPDTSRRDAARTYISRGWPVFALSAGKTPLANCPTCRYEHRTPAEMESCGCLTCHGFYAATLDMDRVDTMFATHPERLLAVRTGAPSGTLVVDVDPPAGIPTMQKLINGGVLTETLTQRTGSGGFHFVYQHPGGYVMSGPGKGGVGIDIKSDGGYIVAAPSIHPRTGEPYRWRFDWAGAPMDTPNAELVRRLRRPVASVRSTGEWPTGDNYRGRLRGLVDTVLEAPDGQRNGCLHWAACKAGEMVRDGSISEQQAYDALATAAQHIGLSLSEIGTDPHHGTIGSGLRKGRAA